MAHYDVIPVFPPGSPYVTDRRDLFENRGVLGSGSKPDDYFTTSTARTLMSIMG